MSEQQNANATYTFDVLFDDFITLYRGVNKVWIGNDEFGYDGVLYAELAEGEVQNLGPVSSYYFAQANGFSGSFSDWVELLIDTSGNAQSALDAALSAEAWAVGQRNGRDVSSSDPTYHNNAKYYSNYILQNIDHIEQSIETIGTAITNAQIDALFQ